MPGGKDFLTTNSNRSIIGTIFLESVKILNLNFWQLTSEKRFELSKNKTSSVSCPRERLRNVSNSLNEIHLSQGVGVQETSCSNNRILVNSLGFQVFNSLGMNQKIA